jgi:iron complex outermembrane receptor protein
MKLVVRSAEEKEVLTGATANIVTLNQTAVADSNGLIVFSNLASGTYKVNISNIGFIDQQLNITVPQKSETVEILLQENEVHEEEEVVVMATRTSRTISDIPTRVEIISGEELVEKGNMKPGDIRMLLNESTGIQTQQTSATSYNSSIRIQGLDGRYTQLLRDGLPLYAGFSGGLSIMQITPLDLKQVEVIKGSSSTLYGGGAIAGLVNLVSKTPREEREISFLSNITTAGGLDLSGFYGQRFGKNGVTVFASRNSSNAFDPADVGLTAIPKFERYTINPRWFLFTAKTNANIGISYITEDRVGGSIDYIKKGSAGYFEENKTDRVTAQANIETRLNEHAAIQFKSSYTYFDRSISIPAYRFAGVQQSSYSELNINHRKGKNTWIAGVNFITDDLAEEKLATIPLRSYHYNTLGGFVQNTWSVTEAFTLETGLRGDYVAPFGVEWLPRISAMLKWHPQLTMRIGGGLGYKTPTVFNEEAERVQFQNILPINQDQLSNERSAGANLDINYRMQLGELGLSINQLFFYTKLYKPLILVNAGSMREFVNANGHLDTKGIETNLKFTLHDFKLFVGYTYADVNTHFNNSKAWLPLTARHRLNNVLMYEKEEKLKIGLEAYYFSRQRLSDGSNGKDYWIAGLMAEKLWERFSVFVNFENFTDTRQTKFESIYTGSIMQPNFRDIYAPVDGFVINGGFKLRF